MRSVDRVNAIAGRGLEGDRYFHRRGTFSSKEDGKRQVTLIEIETVEALAVETGISLGADATRRNLVTRNVPLNHLVGKLFTIGGVTFRGLSLCEPCSYLASKTQPEVQAGLTHRGGLRAEILSSGEISLGDVILPK